MKTGVARPIDGLGRVVIPVEIRRSMGLQPDDYLAFETTDTSITMRKAVSQCVICGSTENCSK